MSEYKRVREFIEGEDAKADDIEAEFDNIGAVLDNGVTSDNLAPGYVPVFGEWSNTVPVSVPASGAFTMISERTFELLGKSAVKFDFYAQVGFFAEAANASCSLELQLLVDGSSGTAATVAFSAPNAISYGTLVARSVVLVLAAGSHNVKFTGTSTTNLSSKTSITNSNVIYAAIPYLA